MKTTTATFDTRAAAKHWTQCLLVKLFLGSGTKYLTTAVCEIPYGGNTYRGAGAAGQIQPLRETTNNEIVGLQMTLAGPISEYFAAALGENVKGRICEVWYALFDPATNQVADAPVLEWKGIMDTLSVGERKGNDGELESVITLTSESLFVTMQRPNIRRHNLTDHQRDYATDLFYDHLAEVANATLVWPARDFFKQ